LWTSSVVDDDHNPDTIDTYLSEPRVSTACIKEAGGPLKYWEKMKATHPHIARFALDFLSAPGEWFKVLAMDMVFMICSASSVDAECAFSVGCLQVNHLQH
jgi:hypothetical protein